MSIKKDIFFCLNCNASAFSREKIAHEACDAPIYIIEAEVTFKLPRTRWGRFIDWVLIDIDFFLAFMGATVINVMVLEHLGWSFKQGLLEGFCLGFILMRLFKEKK